MQKQSTSLGIRLTSSPAGGRGWLKSHSIPLTLALSPKGRGDCYSQGGALKAALGGNSGTPEGWFTEGFDTKDLQEAKALLGQLS